MADAGSRYCLAAVISIWINSSGSASAGDRFYLCGQVQEIQMKRTLLLVMILFLLSPSAGAIIEEDWGNYTRADKSDDSGNNVTLSWLRKSYTNDNENYTVTLKDFDPTGNVVLDVTFKGQHERVILSGEWDANRTKMILTAKMELFNKTMIITPLKMVPPEGVFVCCPEAEININVLRP